MQSLLLLCVLPALTLSCFCVNDQGCNFTTATTCPHITNRIMKNCKEEVSSNKEKTYALEVWNSLVQHKFSISANQQNGQTHSNKSSAIADELLECVWAFCGMVLKGLTKKIYPEDFWTSFTESGQLFMRKHFVTCVQIRRFFWSLFCCIRTGYREILRLIYGKYGPGKTPYLDTFHAVKS